MQRETKQNFPGDLNDSTDQTAPSKKGRFEANSFTAKIALVRARDVLVVHICGEKVGSAGGAERMNRRTWESK